MRRLPWVGVVLVSVMGSSSPTLAEERAPAAAADRRIEPRADELVRKMSDHLASLRSFRVDSAVVDEKVAKDGQKVQFLSSSKVAVRRPDRLRSDRLGPESDVIFRYDGKQISVYGKRTGFYATGAAPARLDEAIDTTRERYGIEAPAADLLVSQPYAVLMEDVTTGRYIGLEPIDGANCHHLAFQGTETDWQIWIQDGAQPVPRRYVITSKKVMGAPQFAASLSGWEQNVALADDLFAFHPPAGAKQIDFIAPEQLRDKRPAKMPSKNKDQMPAR
jgi:hypothetical protein